MDMFNSSRETCTRKTHEGPASCPKISQWAVDGARREVTPSIAEWIIKSFPYENQRRIESGWIDTLSELAVRGSFLHGTQLRFGVVGNRWALLDGQHRLSAVVRSGTSQEFQICVDHYKDEEECRAAYYRIDRGRRRTTSAVLTAAQLAESHGVSKTAAAAAFKAGVIIVSDMTVRQVTKIPPFLRSDDGKIAAIQPWWEEVRIYDEAIRGANIKVRKTLWNATTVAVALVTIRANKRLAIDFWSGIAKDNGLRHGDPRKTLSDKLVVGGATFLDQPILWCAHAWNAWVEGKSIKTIAAPEGSALRIVGTKYKGRK